MLRIHRRVIFIFSGWYKPNRESLIAFFKEMDRLLQFSLDYALQIGDSQYVKIISQITDKEDKWPLQCAAECGNAILFKALLDHLEQIEDNDYLKSVINASNKNKKTPIIVAAKYGHNDIVRLLIDTSTEIGDVNFLKSVISTRSKDGVSSLHWASYNGHVDVVETLIGGANQFFDVEFVKSFINAKNTDDTTVLQFATSNGHLDVVKTLVTSAKKLDDTEFSKEFINAKNKDNLTALYLASKDGNVDIVKAFIDYAYELNDIEFLKQVITSKNKDNVTALHLSANHGHMDVLQTLLDCCYQLKDLEFSKTFLNAKGQDNETALHLAALKGHLDVSKTLIVRAKELEDVEFTKEFIRAKDQYDMTILHMAAFRGHTEVVQAIISFVNQFDDFEFSKAFINDKVEGDITALQLAAINRHVDVMLTLIDFSDHFNDDELLKAFINVKTKDDWPALHFASHYGYVNILKKLVTCANQFNDMEFSKLFINSKNEDGFTALHKAAQHGHVEIVNVLIGFADKFKDDNFMKIFINAQGKNGTTALHFASEYGHHDVVKAIIDSGNQLGDHEFLKMLINARRKDSFTVLHMAAKNGHVDVVKDLISCANQMNDFNFSKTLISSKDKNEMTALHLASLKKRVNIMETLINCAYQLDDVIFSKKFLSEKEKNGCTALHMATYIGDVHFLEVLVACANELDDPAFLKSFISATNKDGITILHLAAATNNINVLKMLVECTKNLNDAVFSKAFITTKAQDESTPLHFAAKIGDVEFIKTLLAWVDHFQSVEFSMKSIDAKREDNWTALHFAARNGHSNVVTLLLAFAKRCNDVEFSKAYINAEVKDCITALHLAAANEHVDVIEALIAGVDQLNDTHFSKAFVNAKSKVNMTALHGASYHGDIDVMKVLIAFANKLGDDGFSKTFIDAKTETDSSPIQLAAMSERVDAVKMLFDCAKKFNDVEYFESFVNGKEKSGNALLHLAARWGHADIVNAIIDHINDFMDVNCSKEIINARNKSGETPLYLASLGGYESIVTALIKAGADVNIAKKTGESPWIAACRAGNLDVENVLQNYGHAQSNVVKKLPAFYGAECDGFGAPKCQAKEIISPYTIYENLQFWENRMKYLELSPADIFSQSGMWVRSNAFRLITTDEIVHDNSHSGSELYKSISESDYKAMITIINWSKVSADVTNICLGQFLKYAFKNEEGKNILLLSHLDIISEILFEVEKRALLHITIEELKQYKDCPYFIKFRTLSKFTNVFLVTIEYLECLHCILMFYNDIINENSTETYNSHMPTIGNIYGNRYDAEIIVEDKFCFIGLQFSRNELLNRIARIYGEDNMIRIQYQFKSMNVKQRKLYLYEENESNEDDYESVYLESFLETIVKKTNGRPMEAKYLAAYQRRVNTSKANQLKCIAIAGKTFIPLMGSNPNIHQSKITYVCKDKSDEILKYAIPVDNPFDDKNKALIDGGNPMKIAVRLSMMKTPTMPTIEIQSHNEIEDLYSEEKERGEKVAFTDGCGSITKPLARRVWETYCRKLERSPKYFHSFAKKCENVDKELHEIFDDIPSLLQIRYRGFKGTVVVIEDRFKKLILRKSMNKFTSYDSVLNIVDFSHPKENVILPQDIVFALLCRSDYLPFDHQHPDEITNKFGLCYLELVRKYVKELCNSDAKEICQKFFDLNGINLLNAKSSTTDKREYQNKIKKVVIFDEVVLKNKCCIPIPESGLYFGCCEPPIEEHSLFRNDSHLGADEVFCWPSGHNKPLEGDVILAKDPCYEKGDILKVRAVGGPTDNRQFSFLHTTRDVIVFSSTANGNSPPTAHKMSGSDLDGDMFYIIWNKEINDSIEYSTENFETDSSSFTSRSIILKESVPRQAMRNEMNELNAEEVSSRFFDSFTNRFTEDTKVVSLLELEAERTAFSPLISSKFLYNSKEKHKFYGKIVKFNSAITAIVDAPKSGKWYDIVKEIKFCNEAPSLKQSNPKSLNAEIRKALEEELQLEDMSVKMKDEVATAAQNVQHEISVELSMKDETFLLLHWLRSKCSKRIANELNPNLGRDLADIIHSCEKILTSIFEERKIEPVFLVAFKRLLGGILNVASRLGDEKIHVRSVGYDEDFEVEDNCLYIGKRGNVDVHELVNTVLKKLGYYWLAMFGLQQAPSVEHGKANERINFEYVINALSSPEVWRHDIETRGDFLRTLLSGLQK